MIYVTRDLLFTHVTEIKYTYLLTYLLTILYLLLPFDAVNLYFLSITFSFDSRTTYKLSRLLSGWAEKKRKKIKEYKTLTVLGLKVEVDDRH